MTARSTGGQCRARCVRGRSGPSTISFVAQAQPLGVPLLTADAVLASYDIEVLLID